MIGLNTQIFKYVIEIEKTASITKAAENLYMGQPTLSKTIKELEASLGIMIFKRTPRGVVPTKDGAVFLEYAKKILGEIDEMETFYKKENADKIYFNVSVPKTSYVSNAFAEFIEELEPDKKLEINFKETDSIRTIKNVAEDDYNLGIVRYKVDYERYFIDSIKEKNLHYEELYTFNCVILISRDNPLSQREFLFEKDLTSLIEIVHGDWAVPRFSDLELKKIEKTRRVPRRIYVYERGSQFDILRRIKNSYMLATPISNTELLDAHNIVQIPCSIPNTTYRDLLIYRKDYKLTDVDNLFISKLKSSIDNNTLQ